MEWNAIMPCNGIWKPMPLYEAGIVSHLRKWDAPPFIRIIWRHNGAMRQCAAWAAVFSGSCMSWPGEYYALQWLQGWKTDIYMQNGNRKIQNQTKGGIHLVSHKKSAFYPLIFFRFDLIIVITSTTIPHPSESRNFSVENTINYSSGWFIFGRIFITGINNTTSSTMQVIERQSAKWIRPVEYTAIAKCLALGLPSLISPLKT